MEAGAVVEGALEVGAVVVGALVVGAEVVAAGGVEVVPEEQPAIRAIIISKLKTKINTEYLLFINISFIF